MQAENNLLRINDRRIPNLVYKYIQTGRKNAGRSRKRWRGNTTEHGASLDGLHPVADDYDDCDDILQSSSLALNFIF